jgi:bacterioferritin
MQGKEQIITVLNTLLASELTAIHEYVVHAEICANWGYKKLDDFNDKRAQDEMKHASKLIYRICFLESVPIVSKLDKITIGALVPAQLNNDHNLELDAITAYNDAIKLAVSLGDNATRDLLEDNLEDEDRHINEIEMQLDQISKMGLDNYLSAQVA